MKHGNTVSVLKEMGLSDKESRVYIAIISLGQGTVSQISKLSELKRSIIYVIVSDLVRKGYVTQIPNKKIVTYAAHDPELLLRKMQATIKNFSDFIPVLRTLGNKGISRPKISFFDTKDSILGVYEKINYTRESLFITSYEKLEYHFPGIVQGWIRSKKKNLHKLNGRHIVPNTKQEIVYAKEYIETKQDVRTLDTIQNLKMDISIFENKVAISGLGEDIFLVLIESQDLVDSLKPIFDIVWSRAKIIK